MGCKVKEVVSSILSNYPAVSRHIDKSKLEQYIKQELKPNKRFNEIQERFLNPLKGFTKNSKVTTKQSAIDDLPPYTEGQNTMTYAGIGSRETPTDIKKKMEELATKLNGMGYKLLTGDVPTRANGTKDDGADQAFAKGAKGNMELFSPTDKEDEYTRSTLKVVEEVHPAPNRLSAYGKKLHARNTRQLFGRDLSTPVDFVIAWTKNGGVVGGTGQALRLAKLKGIPIINMYEADWAAQLDAVIGSTNNSKQKDKDSIKEDKYVLQGKYNYTVDGIPGGEYSVNSDANYDDGETKYKTLAKNTWNDMGKMRDLFNELAAMDEDPDVEHNNELAELLDAIIDPAKKILNEFKIELDTTADKNRGTATVKRYGAGTLKLRVAGSMWNRKGKSATEVYVHELIHMSVEAARQFNKGPLAGTIVELDKLYKRAMDKVTPEMIAKAMDVYNIEEATDMHNYIFGSKYGVSEFIAHGMTNKAFKKVLKGLKVKDAELKEGATLWDKVSHYTLKLLDAIAEMVGKGSADKVDARLAELVTDMWEHNNMTAMDAHEEGKIRTAIGKVTKVTDKALIKVAKSITTGVGISTDYVIDKAPVPISGTASVLKTMVTIVNPFKSELTRDVSNIATTEMSEAMESVGLGKVLAPEGTLMSTLNYLQDDDSMTQVVEKLAMMNKAIDGHRQRIINSVAGVLLKSMSKESKKTQESMTTALLETDAKTLLKDYGIEGILDLMRSPSKVDEAVTKEHAKIDKLINNEKLGNYYKSQAKGLGYTLATGSKSSLVEPTALDIVNSMAGIPAEEQYKAISGLTEKEVAALIESVDRLASIEAIGYTRESDKAAMVKVGEKEPKTLTAVMVIHADTEQRQRIYAGKHGMSMPEKGAVKEVVPRYINTEVMPNDNEETIKLMKKRGYKLAGPLEGGHGFMYVSSAAGLAAFGKQAMSKINEVSARHNMIKMMNNGSKGDKVEMSVESMEVVGEVLQKAKKNKEKLIEGVVLPEMDGLKMVKNRRGEVYNYEVGMLKHDYQRVTRMKTKAPVLLGKMQGEVFEKDVARGINDQVISVIMKDQVNYTKRGKVGKNRKVYIEIGPDAEYKSETEREFAEEQWNNMPKSLRTKIKNNKEGQKYIAVRRDLATQYFGTRSPSVLNLRIPGVKKTIKAVMKDNGLEAVVSALELGGEIWTEMISLQKVDVVIKTPEVLIGNIKSNFALSMALGQAPWEVAVSQWRMFKATKSYLEAKDSIEELKTQYVIDRTMGDSSVFNKEYKTQYRNEMVRLKGVLRDSAVRPLMEAGMFTSIVENIDESDLQSGSRLDDVASKFTSKVPQIVKDGASMLFMTQETPMFKAMMMATQYSDFVARAGRYHFLVGKKGMKSDEAIKIVLDEFVNYNRPETKLLQWLSEMGVSFFHRYFLGANKSMVRKWKTDPTAMLSLAVSGVTSPMDASLWEKNFSYNIYGPVDLVWDQNMQRLAPMSSLEVLGLNPY